MGYRDEIQRENDLANGECLRELSEDIKGVSREHGGIVTIVFAPEDEGTAADFVELLDIVMHGDAPKGIRSMQYWCR